MRSDSESSSAPILLLASSRRARPPSRASKTAAAAMATMHRSNRPSRANRTVVRPEQSARTVTALGSRRKPAREVGTASGGPGTARQPGPGPRLGARQPARLDGRQLREDGLPADRALADLDGHRRARRQVGVEPRAEPDQPVRLARGHLVARLDVAADAAGEQPGD